MQASRRAEVSLTSGCAKAKSLLKPLLIAILFSWLMLSSLAQGYVGFANASSYMYSSFHPPDGIDHLVRFDATAAAVNPFGTNLAPAVSNLAPSLRAQLYYGASSSTEDQLIPVTNAPATFRSSTSASIGAWIPSAMVFFDAPVPFDGVMEGPVNFQVRVWDVSRAATFETAIADPTYDGLIGKSAMVSQYWWWQEPPQLYDLRSFTIGFRGPLRLLTDDGMLGFRSNQFGFSISGRTGRVVIVEASTDLSNWAALTTNSLGTNPVYFSDPGSTGLARRFYRARSQ